MQHDAKMPQSKQQVAAKVKATPEAAVDAAAKVQDMQRI